MAAAERTTNLPDELDLRGQLSSLADRAPDLSDTDLARAVAALGRVAGGLLELAEIGQVVTAAPAATPETTLSPATPAAGATEPAVPSVVATRQRAAGESAGQSPDVSRYTDAETTVGQLVTWANRRGLTASEILDKLRGSAIAPALGEATPEAVYAGWSTKAARDDTFVLVAEPGGEDDPVWYRRDRQPDIEQSPQAAAALSPSEKDDVPVDEPDVPSAPARPKRLGPLPKKRRRIPRRGGTANAAPEDDSSDTTLPGPSSAVNLPGGSSLPGRPTGGEQHSTAAVERHSTDYQLTDWGLWMRLYTGQKFDMWIGSEPLNLRPMQSQVLRCLAQETEPQSFTQLCYSLARELGTTYDTKATQEDQPDQYRHNQDIQGIVNDALNRIQWVLQQNNLSAKFIKKQESKNSATGRAKKRTTYQLLGVQVADSDTKMAGIDNLPPSTVWSSSGHR